ncbi:MAG: glycosyltransferase family 2 protein [bacterium]
MNDTAHPRTRISVVIPAFNEESSLPLVLSALPKAMLQEVIVVDNASTDRTAEFAARGGARVVRETRRGYGSACLAGIAALKPTDIVVFIDADFSDHPEELPQVVAPIVAGTHDFVVGSRMIGEAEPGALLPQARYGNRLATFLIRVLWGHRYTDLGPFRAIRYESLCAIGMCDTNFGWTVEMQIKAIKKRLRITEVPVRYRRRVGVSKITGTVSGTLRAGTKILYTIAKYFFMG